ncbi:efflux RND transporter periplasmic adaptor subunit [Ideonella azotifigens]|uniref:efflux RND transporter periplasmic adaptor subunit n=2 Tax=Ideonella azotifigens TaxID=513160 RepID=UPI001E46DB64|nr:efflux RND transporter periplasmic adaptor subunit [Ideonella azotifigens]MCD2344264.1 efflux RND transporter periplasmic adaptor subunit [Ideonella azotifigens]
MRLIVLPVVIAASLLAACNKGSGPAAPASPASATAAAGAASSPVLLLAPEDLRPIRTGTQASGAVITGSVEPERKADLRAEVAAVVLQVVRDNGEQVKRGDLLVRLDDTSIRDGLRSAEEAERAANQSFEQAERQYQRLKTLQAQGMSSIQAAEDAEIRRNNSQSDRVAANSRVVTARQQLQRTEVRAPFDGVVSDRKVSAGDTAQIGKELIKVIDPASMRFEGLVSADRVHELQPGQQVVFRINGYPGVDFQGKVRRVDASANATTRQVEVLVALTGDKQPRVAGLYAEGRVLTGESAALMLPEASLVREGDATSVWRVRNNTLAKVPVKVGQRDVRSGEYPVASGLADGDEVLRHPGSTLVNGQKVERAAAAASTASQPSKG